MNEMLSRLLMPAATAYQFGAKLRNRGYERGWFKTEDCGVPIISIGNLTAGGTGKTPFTKLLAEKLLERNKKLAVISRGYRSENESGVSRVELSSLVDSAKRFGDEPTMLAHQLRGVPVFVGSEKIEVARFARESANPDLILADDAFQHRRLKRAFDIVLLDATEPWWHFKSLPAGRMREPFSSLLRAHAIVFTKTNLAEPNRLARVKDMARINVDSSRMPLFLELEYRILKFSTLTEFHSGIRPLIESSSLRNEKLFLLSAIGRPAAFQKSVEQETGAKVVGAMSLADHSQFSAQDIANATQNAKAKGADRIVVTEKDAVKLKPESFSDFGEPLVSSLEAVPKSDWNEIHERLDVLGL